MKGGLKGGFLMARKAKVNLTARGVAGATKLGYTADGAVAGLNLQVTQGTTGLVRSWVFRYTSPLTQKRREMGLGSVDVVSLMEARDMARTVRAQVFQGIDPKEQRDAEQAQRKAEYANRVTFEKAATQCIAAKMQEWKNDKHKGQWRTTLATYAFPVIGSKAVNEVTMEDVLKVLEPIWTTKTETATRVRQRIETVMDWAKARKLYMGENPASLKGGLGQLLPKASKISKVEHYPALPYVKVYDFVQKLRTMRGVSPKALEFLLLTAARSGEVLGAKWDEFDLNVNVWTIPAGRMKAGREHRVPLCKRAQKIVREMQVGQQCEFVFPDPTGKAGLSSAALLSVMKKMPDFMQYVPHGLRSTFRDWASEVTNVANETLELALAHTIKNQAEAAYRRGDQLEKRVKLMQQWQGFVEHKPSTAKVLPLERRGKA
jgi:integrase